MKYTENDVIFNDVKTPNVLISGVLGRKGRLNINNLQEEITISNKAPSLINAIDIDWNGAEINGTTINTTAQLLNYIKNNSGGENNENQNDRLIVEQSNYYKWFEKGEYPATPTLDELRSWNKNFAPNRPSGGNLILWMCQVFIYNDFTSIKDPIQISGEDGLPGEDTTKREYIYKLFKEVQTNFPNNYTNPAFWEVSLDDDYTGPESAGWSDDAKSVNEWNICEYMSFRDKKKDGNGNIVWSKFSNPILWSHYGINGMDGAGIEYVFIRTSLREAPRIVPQLGESGLTDEYLPVATVDSGIISGSSAINTKTARCTDDPVGINSEYPYEWVLKRKKINGVWEAYTEKKFALWGIKGTDGKDGLNSISLENGVLTVNGESFDLKTIDPGNAGTRVIEISNINDTSGSYYKGQIGIYLGSLYIWTGSKWISIGQTEITPGSGALYAHIAYADSIEYKTINGEKRIKYVNFTKSSGDKTKKWMGICVNETENEDPGPSDGSSSLDFVSLSNSQGVNDYKWQYTKGFDGNGTEIIYCLTKKDFTPTINDSISQKDEYLPEIGNLSGNNVHENHKNELYNKYYWSDDPVADVDENWPVLWWARRKKVNGVWQAFKDVRIVSEFNKGTSVNYETYYKWLTSTNNIVFPDVLNRKTNSNWINGWANDIWVVNSVGTNAKLYSASIKLVNGEYEKDSNNNLIWIYGEVNPEGEDGMSYEFIYKRFTSIPPTWTTEGANINHPGYINTGTVNGVSGSKTSDDFIPTGWTDNPQGVGTFNNIFYKYEYASIRTKSNGVWSDFIDPFPWSVYGEKGTDGDGYEYIYKLSDTNPGKPIVPDDWENPHGLYLTLSEYVDEIADWEDNPQTPTSESGKSKCWVSTRRKTNGVWLPFSDPAEWSRYTKDGDSGYYPETITKEWEAWSNLDSTANESTAPTTLNNSESDWLENGTPQKPNNPEFKHLWRRSLICDLQSDKTYIGREINGVLDYKYIRLSGTSGTEINLKAKGTVLYILPAESSSDYNGAFNTVDNGELFIIDNVKAVYKKTGNQKTVEISGNDISNGDCYTIQKSSIINESDVKGHLFMWSDEADADGNWIDLGQFQGEEGKTYYTNILWASKLVYQNNVLTSVIGVSVSPSSEKDYMGIYISESLIEDVSILNNEILVSIPWKYIRGPKGTDGVYREWIYSYSNLDNPNNKVSGRIHGEGNLTSDKSLNDWVPEGFEDSPLGISENNKTEYTWYRDKDITTNAWEDFQGPITWAKWGDRGTDGDGVEYVFIRTKSNTPPNIASSILEYTYDSTTYRSINDEYLPLIAKSDDLDSSEGVISINNIDYVKCTDDPSGVTEIYLYEWVAKRKKSAAINGVRTWNNYLGKMSLWAKWSEDGPPGYTIEADRNIILNEDISTPGSFIPITSYLRVKKGSIDCSFTYSIDRNKIPPANAAISGKYLTVTSNLPSLRTTTHSYEISGVLNNDAARAISNYNFDIVLNILDPDTSSTFNYTISINVAVNYLGTWRTTVIGDVETSVGTKINLALIDGKYVKEEKIGEYIRSSGLNVSELTTKIDGVIKDISKIELTSDHISAFVKSSKDFPLQLISNEEFIDTEIINNKIKVKDWSYNSEYWELSTNLAKTVWKNNLLNLNNNYNLITADYNQIGGNKYLFSFDLKTSSNEIYFPKSSSIELSDNPLLISRVYLKAGITYTIAVNYNRPDELKEDDYSINFKLNNKISYAVDPDASLIIPELDGLYEVKVSGTGALSKITCNISTIKVKLINENNFCGNIIVDGEIVESNYSDSDFSYLFTSDSNVNTHHTILLEIDDNNKKPGNVTFYHTLNGPSVIISNLSLKPYGFSNLLGNLYKTGIDIQSGKITAQADKFEWLNTNGNLIMGLDSQGNATFAGNISASNIYSPNIFESICVGGDLCSYVVLEDYGPEIKYHRVYYCGQNIEGRKYSGPPSNGYYYTESEPYEENITFENGKYYSDTILKLYKFFIDQLTLWSGNYENVLGVFTKCTGNSNRILLSKINNNASFIPVVLPRPEDYKGKIIKIHVYLYTQPNLADLVAVNVTCIGNRMAEVLKTSSNNDYPTFKENTAKSTITIRPLKVCIGYNGSDLEFIYPSFNSEFISVKGIVNREENWYWTHINTYSTT